MCDRPSTRCGNYTTQHATEKERGLSVGTSALTERFIDFSTPFSFLPPPKSPGLAPIGRGSDLEEARDMHLPFLLIGPAQLSFGSEEKFAS